MIRDLAFPPMIPPAPMGIIHVLGQVVSQGNDSSVLSGAIHAMSAGRYERRACWSATIEGDLADHRGRIWTSDWFAFADCVFRDNLRSVLAVGSLALHSSPRRLRQ
jgi:hypothetical protein